MKKVLFLCTGNSCRSQIAEGFLKQDSNFEVVSAGTIPAKQVNPNAVKVMEEIGIDISNHTPKLVAGFLSEGFDAVVTVCDHANETCPIFLGQVKKRLHKSFEDPDGHGIEKFIEVRDKIASYIEELKTQI